MKKSHKVALCSIVAVAAVAIVFAFSTWALHALTSSGRLKQMAHDYVQKKWARELTISDLSLSFTPLPQVQATDISISNPAWAHDNTLLQAKQINANLKLFPLFVGHIVVDQITVDDFVLHLQRIDDGRKNWDNQASTVPGTPVAHPALTDVPLYALALSKGTITFRDGSNEEAAWQVDNAHFSTDAGWRDVAIDWHATRDGHMLQVQSKFDNLNQLGIKDAVTDGTVRMQAGSASIEISGQLPLDPALHHYSVHANIDADSLKDVFGFFGIAHRLPAPLKAQLNLRAANNIVDAEEVQLQLGNAHLTGGAHITKRGDTPVFTARLNADRVDWAQILIDASLPPLPPKPKEELFYDHPYRWDLLAHTDGVEGTLHTNIRSFKMRSGIELSDFVTDMQFAGGNLNVKSFTAKMLDGSATGNVVLNGRQHTAHVEFHLKDALLGKWVAETHKKVAITGGRMQINAKFSAQGKSMKELAGSITGPVTFDIGPATVDSKKLSEAEVWLNGLTPIIAAKGSDQFELACIGARLPFEHGIAHGDNLVGIRSDASQLLTSGTVDMHQQVMDLRGPVRVRSGVSIGISTFARKVKIAGKIAKPHSGLDASGAPGTVARIAAAVVTGGASIVATTLWDSVNPGPNPCRIALGTDPPISSKTSVATSKP
jgi:AsmA family protein